jgi:hypothetical protein
MIADNIMQNEPVQLSSTGANVPLLAIEAASEIDELIEGRKTRLDSVTRLAEVLKLSFRLDEPGERQNFIDSGSVAVFSKAIDELSVGQGVSTVKELAQQAMKVVNDLETSQKGSPTATLEQMRDFCIALASAATAYQQSIFEMKPANPLRS